MHKIRIFLALLLLSSSLLTLASSTQRHELIKILTNLDEIYIPVPTREEVCAILNNDDRQTFVTVDRLTRADVKQGIQDVNFYVDQLISKGTTSLEDVSTETLEQFVRSYQDIYRMQKWLQHTRGDSKYN